MRPSVLFLENFNPLLPVRAVSQPLAEYQIESMAVDGWLVNCDMGHEWPRLYKRDRKCRIAAARSG